MRERAKLTATSAPSSFVVTPDCSETPLCGMSLRMMSASSSGSTSLFAVAGAAPKPGRKATRAAVEALHADVDVAATLAVSLEAEDVHRFLGGGEILQRFRQVIRVRQKIAARGGATR